MKTDTFRIFIITAPVLSATIANVACGTVETNQFRTAAEEWMKANPNVLWGGRTNVVIGDLASSGGNTLKPLPTSLWAGVNAKNGEIVFSDQPMQVLSPATVGVFTPATKVLRPCLPPLDQSVILSMSDSNSVPVPKTANGLALGQPLTLKPKTTFFQWAGNNRNPWLACLNTADYDVMTIGTSKRKTIWGGQDFVLDPVQYFRITNCGLYKLTITLRLYVVDTNTYLKLITLPPVTVPIRVEK